MRAFSRKLYPRLQFGFYLSWIPLCSVIWKNKTLFFSLVFQAQDWDLPHRPMTPSRKLDQQNGSSFMFSRSRAPGPAILNRSQPAFKRGYLVKKGDFRCCCRSFSKSGCQLSVVKTKTKVINPTNHKVHLQSNEPIKTLK